MDRGTWRRDRRGGGEMEQALFGLREREEVVQDLERRSLQVKVLYALHEYFIVDRSYSSWRGRNFLGLDRSM